MKWDKVDMCMRHLEADHCHSNPEAWYGLIDGFGYQLRKCHQLLIGFRVEVKEIIDFFLWHDQRVAFAEGIDVEKGKAMLILSYLIAGDLAVDDPCEYGRQMN